MGDRKISNSKSDLQDHSRALAIVSFDRPHTISYQCSIANVFICTVNEILSLISLNFKRPRDSINISLLRVIYYVCTITPVYKSAYEV